jgi:glycosyltransferase involved in cell wall biosynthesis
MEADDLRIHRVADVAVVIPAFNSAAYLDTALASVAGQTVQPAEVVVVDDCSDDETSQRAKDWADRLPVAVIRLERNSGPGAARDHGIRSSAAPLLALLDADDFFLPDHLETMITLHAASPSLVSAQELSWCPGTGLTQPAKMSQPARWTRVRRAEQTQLEELLRSNFVNFGFFARDLYERSGGFSDRYYCEDWELWIAMLRAGAHITMAPYPTAIHRVHAQSLSFDAARIAQHGIEFLSAMIRSAQTPAEAAAAQAGRQALIGKLCFYRALDQIRLGDFRQARHSALGGLPGGGLRASAGLLALAAAPAAAARLERLSRSYRLPDGAYAPGP